MAAYSYEALDARGKTIKGTIDADSAKAARSALREQKLVPVIVTEVSASQPQGGTPTPSWLSWGRQSAFTKPELAVWTRQLASLVEAGLTIERALHSLADEAQPGRQSALMAELLSQVKSGQAFSQALRQHPATFDPVFSAVVAAGEHSGSLGVVLNSLADDLAATQELKSKVVGAALYPAIVSAIAVLIVVFLMVYVLPQVAGAFSSSKRSLPLLTTIMLGISAFLQQWWWLLALLLALAALIARWAMGNESTRLRVHAAMLNVPLAGKLIRSYNAARFAGTLGMLANAGVPILQALTAAANTVGNAAMRRDLDDVSTMVREGAPLGLAIAQKERFPKLVSTFARMGGETGNLGQMLMRVGTQLSAEVQRRAMHMASVLEPMLIVGMGVVVMLIVLAVLMPIIELNSFVK